jgi:PKD domain
MALTSSIKSGGPRRRRGFELSFAVLMCLLMTAWPVSRMLLFTREIVGIFAPAPSGSEIEYRASAPGNHDMLVPSLRPGAGVRLWPYQMLVIGPMYGMAPFTVQIGVRSNSRGPQAYPWDFGDGTTAWLPPGASIRHTYQYPGVYQCWGSVMGTDGRWGIIVTTIVVQPDWN